MFDFLPGSDAGESREPEILVVDDTPANLRLLFQVLTKANYRVKLFKNGPSALAALPVGQPDLVLLDIGLPGMNGYEVAQHLKQEPAYADIPIIFISALDDIDSKVRAFEIGGADYITKPFQELEVLARVRTQLDLRRYEKLRLERQLESERSKLLRTFIDKAAHEFRTPLSSIKTSCEILQMRVQGQDERLANGLERIHSGCDVISHLLDDMLLMVELNGSGHRLDERIDLELLVGNMVESYRFKREAHGLELGFECQNSIEPVCRGNHQLLAHALFELVDNAVKFTPAGGHITVAMVQEKNQAVIHIADTGIGIPDEHLPHVFEQFYRVDAAHTERGFGLGLPIAQRIIEAHGGSLALDSTLDEGTTATVSLPTGG